ncbi:Crp/Fnr family transcriptional regulator [Sulfitobacter aestuariivivens]|uniref:Crp/Fnr family transcriptional regulator n=1 Tax=Sulfitobacter aestuariivivens TaxID=2766981 RepID=A0A927HGM9_9RHOB|nr:Crp/Fnr family transcriptional regulator [Sulfitobacter aestuariivivens]MBD3664420.1 Crp/Fnr family transcriptional regulator [Sulfitobacter aestuariivivens]
MSEDSSNLQGIVTNLQPPTASSPLVRKLGSLCLLSEEEISFLEGWQNNTIDVEAGVDFFVEGTERKTTFIMLEGWSIRYTVLSNGRRQILSYALPGDILGLHINFNAKATYSAAALSTSRLAVVDPRRILEIYQKFPILASGLSWATAREFAILGDQTVRLGRLSAKARLAHLLLELWHRLELIGNNEGNWLQLPMTQSDLADTLGLSLVHTNRSMAALRKSGLVSMTKNHIKLENIDALVQMAEFNPDHLAEFSI